LSVIRSARAEAGAEVALSLRLHAHVEEHQRVHRLGIQSSCFRGGNSHCSRQLALLIITVSVKFMCDIFHFLQ
jgi:hypothetical protein